MTVQLKTPTFEDIQWTGANLSAVQTFVNDLLGGPAPNRQFSEYETGELFVGQHMSFSVVVPDDGYLVFGPVYGTYKGDALWRGLTAAEYSALYSPA